jgi:hypothetical protein
MQSLSMLTPSPEACHAVNIVGKDGGQLRILVEERWNGLYNSRNSDMLYEVIWVDGNWSTLQLSVLSISNLLDVLLVLISNVVFLVKA